MRLVKKCSSSLDDIAKICILQSTDLHMNLYNAATNVPCGIAGLANSIHSERSRCPNSFLFDTGDFLQGNIFGDIAQRTLEMRQTHPAVKAMNAMAYDAVTLGNHDLDYGICYLERALRNRAFEVVLANVSRPNIGRITEIRPLFEPYKIIKRLVWTQSGAPAWLRIGVIGYVVPEIVSGDLAHRSGDVAVFDIALCHKFFAPKMRSAGADIIVVLIHGGISEHDVDQDISHFITSSDLDVVLTGHSHDAFPQQAQIQDRATGPLTPPCIGAGAYGSHLGRAELALTRSEDQSWKIIGSRAQAEPVTPKPFYRSNISLGIKLENEHFNATKTSAIAVAHTPRSLHTYFTFLGENTVANLVSSALYNYVSARICEKTPLLVSWSPSRAGGRSGPDNYVDIAPGPVTNNALFQLYPFKNRLVVLRVLGRTIRKWLEASARIFKDYNPSHGVQPLLDDNIAPYHFDMIAGLSYDIDLDAPIGQRIRRLKHQGKPVSAGDKFLLVTSHFRLARLQHDISAHSEMSLGQHAPLIDEILLDHLTGADPSRSSCNFRWKLVQSRSQAPRHFTTSPRARDFPELIKHFRLEDAGNLPGGFAQFLIEFGRSNCVAKTPELV